MRRDRPPPPSLERIRDAAREGMRTTILAVVASAVLASIKILAGVLGHSYALIADGVESVLDIFASVLVWGGLRASAAAPSARYPYGLGKAEPLAALAIATVLVGAALGIAWEAVQSLRVPHPAPALFTLPVLVLVVVTKEVMFRRIQHAGESIGSRALSSDAWHHRSDALTSLAALVGISVAVLGGPRWAAADEIAALVACVVIALNGAHLFRGAMRDVLDVAVPAEVEGRIRALAAGVEGVSGIDETRVRRSGLSLLVDIHVEVDGGLSVREGHEIAHRVKDRLLESGEGILDALVHVEPAGEDG